MIIAASIAVALALILGGGIWWFLETTKDDGLIYSNVFAAGVDLSGMTEEEAAAAIRAATDDTYSKTELLVTLPDAQLILTPEDTGVSLDAEKLAADAFAYGRSGNRWENFQAKSEAALTEYHLDLTGYLTLDTEFIRDAIEQLGSNAESTLTQPAVTVTGEIPALNRTMDEAAADESVEHMSMTVVLGTPEQTLDTERLYSAVLSAYNSNDFTPISAEYNTVEPDAVDLKALFDDHCVAAVDATMDQQTYEITSESLGYGFSIEQTQELLDSAEPGSEITVEFNFIAPAVTAASLEATLFQDELASFSSPHTRDSNRTNNLVLACEAIDGTILAPGETFSFNEIVGKRTAEKGYKSAGIFAGGKSLTSIGGGICQVASTIYYCSLMADMEIVERDEHGFMVSYVPPGMDATISWGSYDYKFRNNTNYPVRIDASTHDGYCHIALYGTNDKSYYVEMTYEMTGGPYRDEEEIVEFTEDNNPENYKDGEVVQTAFTGYKYRTYRNKYDSQTKELISSEYEASSSYKSRPRIVAKLVTTTEETQPSESTAPSTEPPTTEPPVTDPTTTEPPATEPTVTEPPATEPAVTDPPESTASEPAA